MKEMKRKYIRILKIELADLKDDIGVIMEKSVTRKEQREISEYVFLENMALLKNEVLCIGCVEDMIEGIDLDQYADLDELVGWLNGWFNEMLAKHEMVEAVGRLIQRKLAKVARYVRDE